MSRLNMRQTDVLLLIRKGFRNTEIAQALGLSERTIKWYVSQLLLIFDVTNRTELVGLLSPDDALERWYDAHPPSERSRRGHS